MRDYEKSNQRKTLSAQDFLPQIKTIASLQKAAKGCRGCHLYQHATQIVFGEGGEQAKLTVVGEIPGDKEDEFRSTFCRTLRYLFA